jgi:hypothetical protein
MTEKKAKVLASALCGQVERIMPQSRMPGVRLVLPDGRLAMIDDHGGETLWSEDDLVAYGADGDDRSHITASAEWPSWGLSETWARNLASLIGGEAHQSGGNIWVVLLQRADGRFPVVGDDGVDLYQSAEHYQRYYESDWPEPEYAVWSDRAGRRGPKSLGSRVRRVQARNQRRRPRRNYRRVPRPAREARLRRAGGRQQPPGERLALRQVRKYVAPDASEKEQAFEAGRLGAEVAVSGPYDGNPTGR